MDRNLLKAYQEKILSLIKLLGEKNSLNIAEIEVDESHPTSVDKGCVVIPFKKIK